MGGPRLPKVTTSPTSTTPDWPPGSGATTPSWRSCQSHSFWHTQQTACLTSCSTAAETPCKDTPPQSAVAAHSPRDQPPGVPSESTCHPPNSKFSSSSVLHSLIDPPPPRNNLPTRRWKTDRPSCEVYCSFCNIHTNSIFIDCWANIYQSKPSSIQTGLVLRIEGFWLAKRAMMLLSWKCFLVTNC